MLERWNSPFPLSNSIDRMDGMNTRLSDKFTQNNSIAHRHIHTNWTTNVEIGWVRIRKIRITYMSMGDVHWSQWNILFNFLYKFRKHSSIHFFFCRQRTLTAIYTTSTVNQCISVWSSLIHRHSYIRTAQWRTDTCIRPIHSNTYSTVVHTHNP